MQTQALPTGGIGALLYHISNISDYAQNILLILLLKRTSPLWTWRYIYSWGVWHTKPKQGTAWPHGWAKCACTLYIRGVHSEPMTLVKSTVFEQATICRRPVHTLTAHLLAESPEGSQTFLLVCSGGSLKALTPALYSGSSSRLSISLQMQHAFLERFHGFLLLEAFLHAA